MAQQTLTRSEDCLPCQLRRQAEQAGKLRTAELTRAEPPAPAAPPRVTWTGTLVLENVMTGDGRIIEPNALVWDRLPIPLRWVRSDLGEHAGAEVVGRINTVTRSGNKIIGTGDFDTGSEAGLEAARQVREGLTPGVSVDLDEVSFELRLAHDVAAEAMGPGPLIIVGDDNPDVPEVDELEVADDGRVVAARVRADDEVMVTTSARIRAATLVSVPAFEQARITLTAGAVLAYNPRQARVPRGNGRQSGRWVTTPGGLSAELSGVLGTGSDTETPKARQSDEPARTLAEAAIAGGFTFNLSTGQPETSGFVVARPGSYIVPANEPGKVQGAIKQFLIDHPEMQVIGGWYDSAAKEICIDVVDIVTDRDEAMVLARERNQKAIFDLDNLEEIDTGGTGSNERTFNRVRRPQAGAGRSPGELRRPARRSAGPVRPGSRRPAARQSAARPGAVSARGRATRLRAAAQLARHAELAQANYGYNPGQARVPAGNGRVSGRWVRTPGGLGGILGGTLADYGAPTGGTGLVRKPLPAEVVDDMAFGSAAEHLELGPDGKLYLTEARQQLHDQIAADTLADGQVSDAPRYNFMGGGPAAGKSVMERSDPTISEGNIVINADEIKDRLPEYHDDKDRDGYKDAAYTHEESSYLSKQINQTALDRKYGITMDGTGDSTAEKMRGKIAEARDAGYVEVNGYYVTAPTDEAWRRSQSRADKTGRWVPEKVLRDTHRAVSETFPAIVNDFDYAVLWDTGVNPPIKIGEKTKGGVFKVFDQAAWARFLAKAKEGRR